MCGKLLAPQQHNHCNTYRTYDPPVKDDSDLDAVKKRRTQNVKSSHAFRATHPDHAKLQDRAADLRRRLRRGILMPVLVAHLRDAETSDVGACWLLSSDPARCCIPVSEDVLPYLAPALELIIWYGGDLPPVNTRGQLADQILHGGPSPWVQVAIFREVAKGHIEIPFLEADDQPSSDQ